MVSINIVEKICSKPYDELTIIDKHAIRYNIVIIVESILNICLHILRYEHGFP